MPSLTLQEEVSIKHPRLYICYGMPKSGSTLAFQITRKIAARAGFSQAPLSGEVPGLREGGHFLSSLDGESLSALREVLEAEDRRLLVLKTHAAAPRGLKDEVAQGWVRCQAVCRDPRDIALSMRDAGTRGEVWGELEPGRPIRTPEEVKGRVTKHMRRFTKWAALPDTLCLNYERVAFGSLRAARRIAHHLAVRPAPLVDVLRAKSRFTYLRQGQPLRHRVEMSADEVAAWHAEFRDFIDQDCADIPGWPERQVGRAGVLWTRAMRFAARPTGDDGG